MKYQFTEIFDIPTLTKLCQQFTQLTSKTTSLTDLEGNVHISTGWRNICANFHRQHPIAKQSCLASDSQLANKQFTEQGYQMYQCKNGLVDVAVPIYVAGRQVGNFITGQFFLSSPDKAFFQQQAQRLNFNRQNYLDALAQVPVVDQQEIKQTMKFLAELAQIIGEMGNKHLNELKQIKANEALIKEQKETLALIHQKYHHALSISKIGVWEWHISTNNLYCSQECKMLFGVAPSYTDSSFDTVKSAIHPDDINAWQQDVDACLAGNKTHDIEFRIIDAHNSVHWLHAKGKLEHDSQGLPMSMIGVVIDITQRRVTELALQKSEQNLKTAQQLAQLGSWELDLKQDKLFWSDEIFRIFEIDQNNFEACYQTFLELIHPEDRDLVNQAYLTSVAQKQDYEVEHRLLFNDGRIKYVRELGYTSYDDNGTPLISQGTVQDITDKKLMEIEVQRIAYYDTLTQLPNRNLLQDRFGQAMANSHRNKHYGALLFLDLDNFKSLNDTHGHYAGDLLLQQVAKRLKQRIRATDTLARLGGDEFLILLVDLNTNQEQATAEALAITEQIVIALAEKYLLNIDSQAQATKTISHQCSASIGIAMYKGDKLNLEMVTKQADQAMYQAKKQGKNRVCVYNNQSQAC